MGILSYGLKTFLRNRGRMIGIGIGVIIAIMLVSGSSIATESLTSYQVQESLSSAIVDESVTSSNSNDTATIMQILGGLQASTSYVQQVFPAMRQDWSGQILLNNSGSADWNAVNASGYNASYFEPYLWLAGIDSANLMIPRLQNIINVTDGTFPSNNRSVLVDSKIAGLYNLTVGANFSLGSFIQIINLTKDPLYHYEFITVTAIAPNMTVSGIFSIQNYASFNAILGNFPPITGGEVLDPIKEGQSVIIANFSIAEELSQALTPSEIYEPIVSSSSLPISQVSYNFIIDHGFVDIFDISASETALAQFSTAIIKAGGTTYLFSTNDLLTQLIFNSAVSPNAMQQLLLIASVPTFLLGMYLTSILYGQVMDRRAGEIGQLRSKGATRRQITLWVVVESSIIGGIGGLIGYGAGLVASFFFIQSMLGPEMSSFLATNAFHASWSSLGLSLALAIVACWVAVIAPVRRLNKLSLVDSTKEQINYTSSQPWHSRLDLVVLILGVLPVVWIFVLGSPSGQGLPFEIRVALYPFASLMTALAFASPFLLAYGIIKLVAGQSPARLAKLSQGVASLVTRKFAWLIGRNVARRPKQAGGLVFIIALAVCFTTAASIASAGQVAYNQNEVAATVGSDIEVQAVPLMTGGIPAGYNAFSLKSKLSTLSADIAQVTPVPVVQGNIPGYSQGNALMMTEINLAGINATEYASVADIQPSFFPSNNGLNELASLSTQANGTLLDRDWANTNGYQVGDTLNINFSDSNLNEFTISLEVVGLFALLPGFQSLAGAAVNLGYLNQTVFSRGVGFTPYYLVKLVPAATQNAPSLAREILTQFPSDVVQTVTAADVLAQPSIVQFTSFTSTLDAESFFLVVISGLGLSIIVARSFAERRRELATMRARGMEPSVLLRLQGGEAASLISIGVIIGMLTGIVVGYIFDQLLNQAISYIVLHPFIIPLEILWQVGLALIGLIGTGLIISYYEVKRTDIPAIADHLRIY